MTASAQNINHGFISAQVEPPFAPGKAINAKDAESIGDFASLGDDVPLSDGDFLCGNQGRIDGVGTPDV